VACIGQFKRGKSTLLNALIGQPLLPTGVVPVTSVPTVVRFGTTGNARVRFEGREWKPIPLNEVEEYVSEAKNPENAKKVIGVEIFAHCRLLQSGMCLVDTPGLGSVFSGNTEATHAFLPHIDAAIVLIGADPPLSGEELELVEAVTKQVEHLVFVLNKADRASELEQTAAIEFARKVLRERIGREVPVVFEVSALECLEDAQGTRDWKKLICTLEELARNSGRTLVHDATERAVRRTVEQLFSVIREERGALERPLEDTEHRLAHLRNTLQQSESAMRDLSVLLTAEQKRISGLFEERRKTFLKGAVIEVQQKLTERLASMPQRHNGPAYRRQMNHWAQEIVRAQLTPWFEGEANYARQVFAELAQRFVQLGNQFLRQLTEAGIAGLEELPEEMATDGNLRVRSQFYFHVMEETAAPASPLLWVFDFIRGFTGLQAGIARDSLEFLEELLKVNSSRVQSDVEERVRESRKRLQAEINSMLRRASGIAEKALTRARTAHAEGMQSVQQALQRLENIEREVRVLSSSRD
jgi:GTPase Era involved in 16S rRNA processing